MFFFPEEFSLYYFFFGSTACFFCIKGDKPGDKSGEGQSESEAQQPKPDSGDEKVPLQNCSVFLALCTLYILFVFRARNNSCSSHWSNGLSTKIFMVN